MSESITRGGDLVLVGKAPFILFQRGGDLVLVGKAPFYFKEGQISQIIFNYLFLSPKYLKLI